MNILNKPVEVQELCLRKKCAGERIALVPTMGCFHEGHLSLMRWAAENSDFLGASLFVNPAQFAPGEDLDSYPRTLERDISLAEEIGVDILFVPENEDMYPPGFDTRISLSALSANLCGRSRPQHFPGVATVVCKLLHIFMPDLAVFGRKDWQQLAIIKRMVRDLDMQVRIVGRPIVREKDGLALSSRNTYLDTEHRREAAQIYAGLKKMRGMHANGEKDAAELLEFFRSHFRENIPHGEIDYIQIVDPEDLVDLDRVDGEGLAAAAVYLGGARLIDNILLGEKEDDV